MDIIETLESFNRKERFYVVGQLLGNPKFIIDTVFFEKILKLLDLDLEYSRQYFSAMDYHLDWIYASLYISEKGKYGPNKIEEDTIKGTQEDIDFIISFTDKTKKTHIILIEAKGYGYFKNSQIQSKAKRLSAIFGDNGTQWENIVPHFILLSHKKPNLKKNEIPKFMLNKNETDFNWLKLNLPKRRKVTRCGAKGDFSDSYDSWKTDKLQ